MTYYYEWKGNYGSCGLNRSKVDPFYVAALSRHWMKLPDGITNPNKHPLCRPQHCVKINGRRGSVVLKISDTCFGCKESDVDIADEIFPMLEDPRKGRVKMDWQFVNCKGALIGRQSKNKVHSKNSGKIDKDENKN